MSKKRNITLINDYEDGVYFASAKEIKNGLSLRGISIQSANGGHYYDGMVWGGDFKASDILMLLHSQISSNSGEIQSIVKWAKENKKPLIIVVLDDTPLICAWELILADYKQYQIIKYNEENPNDTIFEIEDMIKNIVRVFFEPSFVDYIFMFVIGLSVIHILVFSLKNAETSKGIVATYSMLAPFAVCMFFYAVYRIGFYLECRFSKKISIKDDLQQDKILKTEYKKNTQSTLTGNKKIEYKCFIAGATTITEERDAVRASLSQVVNRWGSLDIMLSSYIPKYTPS